MTTGEKIRYFRTSHELTQEQLASQSGLSISALQKYESDERKPKPEQLFRMEEQANLRFYKDTTTDTVGIYFENEYITEKISSYAEMLREIDSMNPSHQELMHTKIQNELLNDNTSIQEVSVITSSSHKDAVSSLAVEEKLLDIISDCTPAEREQILDALTFFKNWMRTAKEK